MAVMTEEEADALDELLTRTTPKVNPAVRGITARKGFVLGSLDPDVAEYLRTQAAATGQTQGQIASTIIREKFAKGA